jgi:hypothetical protein
MVIARQLRGKGRDRRGRSAAAPEENIIMEPRTWFQSLIAVDDSGAVLPCLL